MGFQMTVTIMITVTVAVPGNPGRGPGRAETCQCRATKSLSGSRQAHHSLSCIKLELIMAWTVTSPGPAKSLGKTTRSKSLRKLSSANWSVL